MLVLRSLLSLVGGAYLLGQFVKQRSHRPPRLDPGEYAHKIADEMPLYGVEPVAYPHPDYRAARQEADAKLTAFIDAHKSYPPAARKAKSSGTAVITFHVETDGTMKALRVTRDPGHRLGAAALQVVSRLAAQGERWRPAYRDGVAVRFHFNLPVKFGVEQSGGGKA
ncbi:energy transducer TonB [Neolewinella sp.]|uniref:energy transducer TonB n=1 Tax=Neolewinella sp. TaxID=2993543 RepID=UPI003B518560